MIDLAAALRMMTSGHHATPLSLAVALERVRRAARCLPAALTDTIYLEIWLEAPIPRIDMICRITRAHRHLLTTAGQQSWLPPSAQLLAPWTTVARFAEHWSHDIHGLDVIVQHLWLEFDLAPDASNPSEVLPPPGVFADFTPSVVRHQHRAVRTHAAETVFRALVADLDVQLLHLLRASIESLPDGASMPYVGVLLPRGTDTLRICVDGLTEDDPASYLNAINWRGDLSRLAVQLDRFRADHPAGPSRSLLHVDLSMAPMRTVALELRFDRTAQVRGMMRESEWLDALVAADVCDAELAALVKRWPQCVLMTLPHQWWTSLVTRRLNHVKVVVRDETVQAKVYLSVAHRHFRRLQRAADAGAIPESARRPSDAVL